MTEVLDFRTFDPVDDRVVEGLRGYLRAVATTLGLSLESCAINPHRPASAYVAVDVRLARFPDRELALSWDEYRGWTAIVESDFGQRVTTIARCDGDVTPAPERVQDFVDALVADTPVRRTRSRAGRCLGKGSLVQRLHGYA